MGGGGRWAARWVENDDVSVYDLRMDWDDVRHFLALAQTGSVRAAGAALGVSHSTVARRVESLEGRLAARLFDRTPDGYVLTEAGRRVMPKAQRVDEEFADLERSVAGDDERMEGLVSVTCCDSTVCHLITHALAELCREHPGLALVMSVDGRLFDLSRREADIAIRAVGLDAQPPEHLLGRRVAPLLIASYVACEHAQRLDPDDPGTRWLGFDDPKVMRLVVETSSYPNLPAWGSFSSLESLVSAVRAGLGLTILPAYIGDRDPYLQRLPMDDVRHMADLWVLSHPDLRDNARLRAAKARVTACFEEHAALFRGERCRDATERHELAPSADAVPR